MNRRDLTARPDLVEGFLQSAILRCQRGDDPTNGQLGLRVPAMEKSVSITWSGVTYPNGELPIPNDLLELVDITFTDEAGSHTLSNHDLNAVLKTNAQPGRSQIFSRRGSKWLLGPTPGDGTTIRIDYYGTLPTLAADADQNWLTNIGPDVIIYGALSYACDYYDDKRLQKFEQRYLQAVGALQAQSDMDELTGSAGVSPAYTFDDGLN